MGSCDSAAAVAAALNSRITELACELLGPPNRGLSTTDQMRFGNHGSVAVEIKGDAIGRWYDHEAAVGGAGIELIKHVQVCSLGDALDWARDWLGWPPFRQVFPLLPGVVPVTEHRRVTTTEVIATETASPAVVTPARTRQSATSGAQDAAKRADKIAGMIARAADPQGSPVELYLKSRSITTRGLPASIRYLPNAYSHYGALMALATDLDGGVHGLQLIYLTQDGKKAPLDIQKRTNKAHDGWSDVSAVRLPGTLPLILCEGVETALSVWQATGQETWACLGISNIARAPVPDGAPVIIARDGDEPASKADQQLRQAVTILRGQGREVSIAEPPAGRDFNDVLRAEGEDAVRSRIAVAVPGDTFSAGWRKELLLNDEGEARPVLANAILALRRAPQWDGVLWHDAFATATTARRPPPWLIDSNSWADTGWSDRDDALVADWLQHQEIMVPVAIAGQAVEVVARDRTFHPVEEYLDGLVWDGAPRLDLWLCRYLGAADTAYHRAVGPRWVIAAVARIDVPGCKADCALILEGPQGIRKSSALKALAQPWFTDRLSDLGSKDAAMETRGVWVIEIAELDTMSRADVGTIKAFMSRTHDRFRPPYGKRLVDLPRQCSFAGSVNPEGGYLKDATGGRRFWPVACGTIDLPALERDRDQLWAEARARYQQGEPWWLETQSLDALAAEQQAERYQGDAWDEMIRSYLENDITWAENGFGERLAVRQPRSRPLDDVSVAEVMEKALDIDRGRWTQPDQNRVVRSLISMGFQQYRRRGGGHGQGAYRERRYRRPRLNNGAG